MNTENESPSLVIAANATRRCNYRCPYCFNEKMVKNSDLFAYHSIDEWLNALRSHFSCRKLDFYFSGGEPFIYKDFISFVTSLSSDNNVSYIKIDTNGSVTAKRIGDLDPSKIKLMLTWHPSQVSFSTFKDQAIQLHKSGHLEMINFVAYPFDYKTLKMVYQTLSCEGIFVNIGWNINAAREYTDMQRQLIFDMVTPQDAKYKSKKNVRGLACNAGKNYIELDNKGNVYRCRMQHILGNIFDSDIVLKNAPVKCPFTECQCIVRYPLLQENTFPASHHMSDYVKRNREYRRINRIETALPTTPIIPLTNFPESRNPSPLIKKIRKIADKITR